MDLKDFIAAVPDFPKSGIIFRDVSPLLAHHAARDETITRLAKFARSVRAEYIAGFDARGFIFGVLVAEKMGIPFIMLRKKGKLPGKTHSVEYELEYGIASLEIQEGILPLGGRVLLVDDLLATGGTAKAGISLVEQAGGIVVGLACVIELISLGGRARLDSTSVYSEIQYD